MKSIGHTTTEFAICLALLGILSIGSLKLLGGNISDLLGAFTKGPTITKTDQLFSLIGASTNINSSGSNTPGILPNAPVVTASLQLKLDPNTGQVLVTDTTGGSKNTTSVDGSTAMPLMAQQIGLLANVKLANGQPLPTDLKRQILQLMQDGIGLSNAANGSTSVLEEFNTVNASNTGKTSGFTAYPDTVVAALGTNLSAGMKFQQDFNGLKGLITNLAQTDPRLINNLLTPLSQLAGAISSVAYNGQGKELATNFNINAANTSTLLKVYQDNPLLEQGIPVVDVIQSASLPPEQRGSVMQKSLTDLTQSTLVGTPITAGNPVNIALALPNGTAPNSATLSGTIPGNKTLNVNTSISINAGGITASASASAP